VIHASGTSAPLATTQRQGQRTALFAAALAAVLLAVIALVNPLKLVVLNELA
jgi:hypothetical protein